MAKAETRLMDIILVPRFPAPWNYVEKEERPGSEVGFLYFTCTKQHTESSFDLRAQKINTKN